MVGYVLVLKVQRLHGDMLKLCLINSFLLIVLLWIYIHMHYVWLIFTLLFLHIKIMFVFEVLYVILFVKFILVQYDALLIAVF